MSREPRLQATPAEAAEPEVPAPLGSRILEAAFTPHVLVMLLVFLASIALLASSAERRAAPAEDLSVTQPRPPATIEDVRLVLIDDAGLEWSRVVPVALPERGSARMAAVVDALRAALVEEDLWPSALPTPRVFVETFDRRRVAVIDVAMPQPIGVTVARERALLRALIATVEANGVDEVRFLREGRPTETLLGHVAVPSAL
jgi:hypothetical protein